MTELETAYIAGLFDGEGHVSFQYPKATNGKRYGRIEAKITNTDKAVLDWVKSKVGFGTIHVTNRRPRHLTCFAWQVARRQAREFLGRIRPHLRIKAQRVSAVLEQDKNEVKGR
jgi:hypothetical protein